MQLRDGLWGRDTGAPSPTAGRSGRGGLPRPPHGGAVHEPDL